MSLLLFLSPLRGQHLPGAKAMDIPSKYILPESGVDLGFSASRMSGVVWKVYADRAGVKTTEMPGKGKEVASLDFLHPLYVYEDDGEYLHVIFDPAIEETGTFSLQAKDMGWLAKSRALLWTHCLVVPGQHNRNIKALAVNTPASLQPEMDPYRHLKKDSIQCFVDPSLQQANQTRIPMFGLYFVYKYDSVSRGNGGAMLIGLDIRAPHADRVEESVVGWVPAERLVTWDRELALEPNTDKEAWEERKGQESSIQVFAAQEAADRFQRGLNPIPGSVWWDADPRDKRPFGSWWRFPILGEKDGIVKLGLLGSLPEAKDTLSTPSRKSNPIGPQIEDLRQIHVLFVIGASKELQPKLAGMSKVIKNMLLELSTVDMGVAEIRYGAVVYRDYSPNQKTTEVLKMTNRPIQVLDFLNQQAKKSAIGNPDPPVALYHGLQAAFTETGTQPEHTQLMILLGDAGDHGREDPSQVKVDDVIQLLAEYQSQVYACQVQHPGKFETYDQFSTQLKLAFKMSAIKQYQVFKKKAASMGIFYPKMREIRRNTVSINNGLTESILVSSPKGTGRSMEFLQTEMTKAIQDMIAKVNEQWGAIPVQDLSSSPTPTPILPVPEYAAQPKVETVSLSHPPQKPKTWQDSLLASPFVSYLTPSAATYLQQERELSSEQLLQITQNNFPIYLPAYAPLKIETHQFPLFKYVRLYSRQELSDLIRELTDLARSDEQPDPRTTLHQIWKGLLSAHTGYISADDAKSLRFQRAAELVFGMPETHQLLAGKRIGDLLNPRSIKDTDIQQYLRAIRDSLRELQRIFHADNYPYSFESVNRNYYWIRQDLFP